MMTLEAFFMMKAASSAEPSFAGFFFPPLAPAPAGSAPNTPAQHQVAEREADAGRGPPRIGIEHRDHDRHVGAADRDDHEHAERERNDDDQPEIERASAQNQTDNEDDQCDSERDVDDVARG